MATIDGLVEVIKYQLGYNRDQKGKKPPAVEYDIKNYIKAPNAAEEVDPFEPPAPTHPPPPPPTQSTPPTSEESDTFSEILVDGNRVGFKINNLQFLNKDIYKKMKEYLNEIKMAKERIGNLKTGDPKIDKIPMIFLGDLVGDFKLYAIIDRYSTAKDADNKENIFFYVTDYDFAKNDELSSDGGANTKKLNHLKKDGDFEKYDIYGLPKPR